jgi:hypothetical protein
LRTPLFSIACTTCRARIAVLREEAIGTILGCPKCGGMVLIAPPENWVSAHATELKTAGGVAAVAHSGPPPLSKVSQTFLTLDLEAAPAEGWPQLLSRYAQSKVVWTGAAASALSACVIVWLLLASGPTQEEVAKVQVAPPKVAAKRADVPKVAPVEKVAEQPVAPPVDAAVPAVAVAKAEEAKPIDNKPADADAKKVEPAAIVAEPKHEDKTVEEKPIETAVADARPVEAGHAADAPAVDKDEDPPKVAAADAPPALRSIPDLPPVLDIKPLPDERPSPLPVTAAKLVKQAAPAAINADAYLDDVVPSLELKDVPLARALAIVSSMSGLPITLDADAMRREGISAREPISVSVKQSTVEKLLEEIATRCGLGVEVEQGQVVITAPAEQTDALKTIPYTVSDLCEHAVAVADLAELVQKFVAPDSWKMQGGQGTIEIEEGSFRITQTIAVHHEIVIFCEKLRLARGLPQRSKLDARRVQLASASVQAKTSLGKLVSANFHDPTTLAQVLDTIGVRADVDILLDRRALAAAGMSDKLEVSYAIEKQTLEAALDGLLRPLGLGFRAIDSRTLQVSTQKDLDHSLQWEIYPIGKLLSVELTGAQLIAITKQAVAPSSWASHGQIFYDAPSKALIVSQSPAVHAALVRYFAEKTAAK